MSRFSRIPTLRKVLKAYEDLLCSWDVPGHEYVTQAEFNRKRELEIAIQSAGFRIQELWDADLHKRVCSLEWAPYPEEEQLLNERYKLPGTRILGGQTYV